MNIVCYKFDLAKLLVPEENTTVAAGVHSTIMYSDFFPDVQYVDGFDKVPEGEGAVVFVNGGSTDVTIQDLNEAIRYLPWVVVAIFFDEGSRLPLDQLRHPNMRVWVQEPKPGRNPFLPATIPMIGADNHNNFRRIPLGYTFWAKQFTVQGTHVNDWFFIGRNSSEDWLSAMRKITRGIFYETTLPGGVAIETQKRIDSHAYMDAMSLAKVVICRPGMCTPETSRVYEALEAGCIPIVPDAPAGEGWKVRYDWSHYWEYVLGEEPPFPVVNPEQLADMLKSVLADWSEMSKRVREWWARYKRRLGLELNHEIGILRSAAKRNIVANAIACGVRTHNTTILVISSVIAQHPSLDILEETLASVRFHFPEASIIVLLDGLRKEQMELHERYREYRRRVAWHCDNDWSNTTCLPFSQHMHQSGMVREALSLVKTPTMLLIEHDTPLRIQPIPWRDLAILLQSGAINSIRFAPDAETSREYAAQPYHQHHMLDKEPILIDGRGPVIRTTQWSARPNLAATEFYRRVMREDFSPDSKAFIEIRMAGLSGVALWDKYRLAVYAPQEGPLTRSYHLDGSKDAPHFTDSQVF